MTKSIFRICSILALGFATSQTNLSAQDTNSIRGVWDVSVTVTNCQTGALIRTVRSVQLFSRDGSFSETASTFLRGSSEGIWNRAGDRMYSASFWFFRYKPDGTFASIAKGTDAVVLSQDGNEFNSAGTVQDFDANNVLLSTGCVTHSAKRLSGPGLVP
jgi:hypothetical protein